MAFVRGIGIEVRTATLPEKTVLPGLDGYRGEAASIIKNFTAGRHFGVPMLQFYGMALEPKRAAAIGVEPYPHMLRWLR